MLYKSVSVLIKLSLNSPKPTKGLIALTTALPPERAGQPDLVRRPSRQWWGQQRGLVIDCDCADLLEKKGRRMSQGGWRERTGEEGGGDGVKK
jgi:hypothetical protein